jgi:CheY-like chemotaxis protein
LRVQQKKEVCRMHSTHRNQAVNISAIAGWGTLLLAEDDAGVRNLTRTMLEMLGYDVLTAQDGAEALEIFEAYAHLIRLVISDLEMPGFNGWEVLTAVRRRSPDLPVILASGYNEIPGGRPWCDDRPPIVLAKPYTLDTVRRVLETALVATLQ